MLPLPFAPPALSDASQVRLLARTARQSDLAFANMYLLRHKYGTELALEGGFLFRHFSQGRLRGYAFPCGEGDWRQALRRVEEDALVRCRPCEFCLLTAQQVDCLEGYAPGRFSFAADPGDADYVYARRSLAELPGAKLHRKRNHLARFYREFPGCSQQVLSAANAGDALQVARAWLEGAEDESPALHHEFEAIKQALEHREELGLFGVLLYIEGAPVALALASMISPQVADVHYEKCHPAFRSAYPAINQALAALLDSEWVNREEDLNNPGLRQAKLSYYPAEILTKYSAQLC